MADERPPRLAVDIGVETDVPGGPASCASFARRVLRRAFIMEAPALPPSSAARVSLVLTDDAGIAALNRTFRGLDEPTDVLSFPQLEASSPDVMVRAPGAPLLLGDVVVSIPRALEQAERFGHSFCRELGFLLVHGFLHLLGHDHATPAEARAMEARQEAVLTALGLDRAAP